LSEILSQAEIEALLASLAAEDSSGGDFGAPVAAPVGGMGTSRKPISYEVYDFRRPDKFSRDQLRTLQMVFETFARLCSTNLATYLRTPVHIELISLEQIPYEDYLRSLKQSAFIVFSAPPLSGEAVLEMEFALVFTMLDRLLGGMGKPIARNAFTEIEKPLVLALAERMLMAYRNAWESILQVDPKIEDAGDQRAVRANRPTQRHRDYRVDGGALWRAARRDEPVRAPYGDQTHHAAPQFAKLGLQRGQAHHAPAAPYADPAPAAHRHHLPRTAGQNPHPPARPAPSQGGRYAGAGYARQRQD
jgi:hypothetical protein